MIRRTHFEVHADFRHSPHSMLLAKILLGDAFLIFYHTEHPSQGCAFTDIRQHLNVSSACYNSGNKITIDLDAFRPYYISINMSTCIFRPLRSVPLSLAFPREEDRN